jgi:hypothetical protein
VSNKNQKLNKQILCLIEERNFFSLFNRCGGSFVLTFVSAIGSKFFLLFFTIIFLMKETPIFSSSGIFTTKFTLCFSFKAFGK